MLRHSQDQIGLHRGWGADKPIDHVYMEIDPLGTFYRLGKFPRVGGQADVVHSAIDYEVEVFPYRRCHGMCRYESCMSMDMVCSLSLMDDLIHAWVSILDCEWPDGHSGGRDLWQDIDPLCSLAPGKRSIPVELIATNQGGPQIGADTICNALAVAHLDEQIPQSSHACRFEGW